MKTLLTIFILLAMSVTAHATAIVTGASVSTVNGALLFSLLFDHTPDFAAMDQFGRPAESFQWYLTDDLKASRPMAGAVTDYIIRGDGISEAGNVRMCTTRPLGSGCPGGWGLDLGPIPSFWNPETLSLAFSVPLDNFSTNTYSYDVISLKYGAQLDAYKGMTDGGDAQRWGPACSITIKTNCYEPIKTPESSALILLPIGLMGLWMGRKRIAASSMGNLI